MRHKDRVKTKPKLKITIPEPVLPDSQTIQFSFKHVDLNNSKFSLDRCPQEFWWPFLAELHRYSQFPIEEFENQSNDNHRHIITFDETSEPNGFTHLDMEQLGYVETWQFAICVERWRVIGFLVAPIFYVVWLDPSHALYNKGSEGTRDV